MEKNLPERSGSFAGRDESNDSSETPPSPTTQQTAEVDNNQPADEKEDLARTEEETNGEKENKEEENDDTPPEFPPLTLEKASKDIDRFLQTPQQSDEQESEKSSFEIPAFIDKFLDLIEENISKYDSGEDKTKRSQISDEDESFFEGVDRISKLLKSPALLESPTESEEIGNRKDILVNRIGGIQQRAMAYLEYEFRSLLDESRSSSNSDPGGHNDSKGKHHTEQDRGNLPESETPGSVSTTNFPNYPGDVVSNLKKIAREMISGGYEAECFQIYEISRRTSFDESLHKLGFDKIGIDEIQRMQWETLEREIPAWIKTFKQCANVYFPGERKLAETIFADQPSASASLFSNLARGVLLQLVNFAEGVALTKRSAEKLFKCLDLYEALRDAIVAMDDLWPEECLNELKTETTSAKSRLGEAAILIFCDLENSIRSDVGKTPVPGGSVHPLTSYTMNYLEYACEYKETLEQVFKEHSKIERADSTSRPHYEGEGRGNYNYNSNNNNNSNNSNNGRENQGGEKESPFAGQLMRVMDLLDSNLESKAKLYKDVALSNIFLMNNGRYILQKIKGASEIFNLIGSVSIRKRSADLRQYHKNYQRETWSKVLGCLSHEGLTHGNKVMKPVLKERFKSFNAMFDEIHKTQSTWAVRDEQLQSELRVSISAVVIPAYRSFLGRFAQTLDPGRQTEKYIKFQPEDIENYIDELFDGNAASMARKKP